jgi:hypothetical protein
VDAIPFAGEAFDCIAGSGILEYLDDPSGVLCALRPRMTDGGRLIVSYFNMRHVSRVVGTFFGRTPHRHPAWRNELSLDDCRAAFRNAGFAVLDEIPSSVGLRGSPSIGGELLTARAVRAMRRFPLIDHLAHQKVFVCEAVHRAP